MQDDLNRKWEKKKTARDMDNPSKDLEYRGGTAWVQVAQQYAVLAIKNIVKMKCRLDFGFSDWPLACWTIV